MSDSYRYYLTDCRPIHLFQNVVYNLLTVQCVCYCFCRFFNQVYLRALTNKGWEICRAYICDIICIHSHFIHAYTGIITVFNFILICITVYTDNVHHQCIVIGRIKIIFITIAVYVKLLTFLIVLNMCIQIINQL